MLALLCTLCIVLVIFLGLFVRQLISLEGRKSLPHLRQPGPDGKRPILVGFFHPYCNAGGGGERVLWIAIRALQNRYPNIHCVVYTGDADATKEEIMTRARQRFNVVLPRPVEFVFLRCRTWVEAKPYPYFTLLGQSLGSLVLGCEALAKFVPDIYIDTMGYAFTTPLFKYLASCKTACYVHYPTISTDMLEKVTQRTAAHNNARFISQSLILSTFKLIYYRFFAFLYGLVGSRNEAIMVNSSWTHGHIVDLWGTRSRTNIVYPPCDTEQFLAIPLENHVNDMKTIVSIGQFRPEKDHPLQINSFHIFLQGIPNSERFKYKLELIGSCRNTEDMDRVSALKNLVGELGIEDNVSFQLNVPFAELKERLGSASVGIHTMWNEHFGIGVVEIMAAGAIVLAHNSGGPKMDIVVDNEHGEKTGFLADSKTSYAEAMSTILSMSSSETKDMQLRARETVERFSEREFEHGFLSSVESLIRS